MSRIAVKWVMPYKRNNKHTGDIPGVVVTVAGSIVIVGVKVIYIYPTYCAHPMLEIFDKWMNDIQISFMVLLSDFNIDSFSFFFFLQKCQTRCSSRKAAVVAQQPRKIRSNVFIYPRQSSRRREHRRKRRSSRRLRFRSQEGASSDSSSICDDVPCFRIKRLKSIGCNKRRPSYSDTDSDFIKMPVGEWENFFLDSRDKLYTSFTGEMYQIPDSLLVCDSWLTVWLMNDLSLVTYRFVERDALLNFMSHTGNACNED